MKSPCENLKSSILGKLAGVIALLPAVVPAAPVPVAGTTVYQQNFDSLGASSVLWANDSTIPGWYAQINNGNTATGNAQATDGSTVLSGLLNLGASGSPDRALGSKCTGTGNMANISYGVLFRNTGTTPVALTQLLYTGELWRTNSGTGTPLTPVNEEYTVFYRISDAPVTNLVSGTGGASAAAGAGFLAMGADANWVSPVNTPLAAQLDGNLDANRQSVAVTPAGITVLPSQYLMIKWTDANEAGTDGFQGIEGVRASFMELNGVLTPAVSTVTRHAAGTPANPADDTFGFTLTVAGAGNGIGTGWTTGDVTAPNATGAAYGAPVVWTGFPVAGPKTAVVADNSNPSFTAAISVEPPRIIGTNNIDHSNVITSGAVPVQWLIDETAQTLTMTNGGGAPAKVVTASAVNLSAATGVVRFSAVLETRDTSSGFESGDTFLAELVLNDGTGTTSVNLVTPYDANGSGVLQGSELAVGGGTPAAPMLRTLQFSHFIPDNVVSAQLIISGNNDSASETMILHGIAFDVAPPTVVVTSPANIVRHENGPGLTDDTVTFDTVITGVNGGAGWRVSGGATPVSGAWGPVTFTIPADSASVSLTITDASFPAAATNLTVKVPARYTIGRQYLGGALIDLFSDPAAPPDAAWINDPAARTLQLTTNDNADKVVVSDRIDLSTAGAVEFYATFRAREISTGSNFESTDRFKAELLIDGGMPTEQTVNLISAWDTGNGASAVSGSGTNGAPDGYLNGYAGAAGTDVLTNAVYATALEDYNAHTNRDEFNPGREPGGNQIRNLFALSHVIPAAASSVQLRITGAGISASEFFTLFNVLFSSVPSTHDSDGDGVPDLTELRDGTDPHDPFSLFNLTGLMPDAGNPGNSLATFPTANGRFYQGYFSSDLLTWTRDDTSPAVTGDGAPHVWPLSSPVAPGTRRYLKIQRGFDAGDFPATLP